MADTEIGMEAEMVDMVADLEKKTHEREATRAVGTTMKLASREDTRCKMQDDIRFVLRWVSRISLPFITRGKPFFDALSSKVVYSPQTCSHLSTLHIFIRYKSFPIYFYGNASAFDCQNLHGSIATSCPAFCFTTCLLCFD